MQIPKIDAKRMMKDPVHGYIPMTDAEYRLVQLPLFMRLHRVRQNSMAYLTYPGALASRFEHVVGAMFMGSKIATQVLAEMAPADFEALFPGLDAGQDVGLLIKSARLACLFHDVGHGPFSHASERIMASATPDAEMREAESVLGPEPAIHEYFSYKLIQTDGVGTVLERENPALAEAAASLLVENPASRMARENGAGFGVFRKIVSGQLDADRADYLARDSLMAGVAYGRIDFDRIVNNMAAVPDRQGRYELAVHHRALGAVEEMLEARYKMYRWVYRHHAVGAADMLVEDAIKHMVDNGVLDRDLLHWKSFETGRGSDDYVLDKLMCEWGLEREKYANYRGLWDRRHFPVSLLKHPADYSEFAKQAIELTKRNMADSAIVTQILRFTSSPNIENHMTDALSSLGEPLRNTYTLIKFGGSMPYRPIDPSDTIWLYTDDDGSVQLHELTKQSAYANYISEEWRHHPSMHIAYIVPGLCKDEVTHDMKAAVKDAAVRAIFG